MTALTLAVLSVAGAVLYSIPGPDVQPWIFKYRVPFRAPFFWAAFALAWASAIGSLVALAVL